VRECFIFEASKAKQRSRQGHYCLGYLKVRLRTLLPCESCKQEGSFFGFTASYVGAGHDALETEGNDTTSDSELQSSDSEDDQDDSEDDEQSDCSEMDGFVEHSYEVLFVRDGDVERVTVQSKK